MNSTIVGLLVVIVISAIAGWLFCRSKKVEKPVKAMLFVLYFWMSFFVQLMVFALLYQFGMLDSII